jgi:hypothetical protein
MKMESCKRKDCRNKNNNCESCKNESNYRNQWTVGLIIGKHVVYGVSDFGLYEITPPDQDKSEDVYETNN